MKHSRRFENAKKLVDRSIEYELLDGLNLVKSSATTKMDETVEISVNLGVDPRHADQMIRSTVSLPHGIGKVFRILVLCKEDRVQEALEAGADFAGLDEYIAKIQEGWFEFDAAVATPDCMPMVGRIGKILGPRGLMPNPKTGTVTSDIVGTIKEIKSGRISFRVDRYGILHIPIGKVSFDSQKLYENVSSLLATVSRLRPASAKGQYFKKISLASTMGPGVRVNRASALASIK